ncbi:MAG: OsmC family protein [Planctomycetes bacterium]|nr:OsmC family protein [Planctomycetota bacterium]
MDKEQLRAIQAPFKEKYRKDPSTALVTVRATGRASTGLAFTIESRRGPMEAGPHPATGGAQGFVSAEEMLLEALIACSGVTLQAVATSFGVPLREAQIVAEGDVDLRGTLALSKDVPVGFREIRLRFELDADAPEEKLNKIVEVTERYCVVLQTLRQPTTIRATRARLPSRRS